MVETDDVFKTGLQHLETYVDSFKKAPSWGKFWILVQEFSKVIESSLDSLVTELKDYESDGKDKIDFATDLINESVNIPLVPERWEGAIIKFFVKKAFKKIERKKN